MIDQTIKKPNVHIIMTQAIEKQNLELDLRFAHIDGHTELDFVPDKK